MVRLRRAQWLAILLLCAVREATAAGAVPPVDLVMAATDHGHGLVAVVGTTDGAFESALAAAGKGNVLVQGIASNSATAQKARAAVFKEGQAGYAAVVAQPTFTALPYNDNTATVIVADLDVPGAPTLDEILRVVHPFGKAIVRRRGAWEAIPKALPKEMDDWTHYDRGADGNPTSRDSLISAGQGLQWWVSGHGNKATTIRLGGGRRFQGIQPSGPYVSGTKSYQARNAFNGLPIWRKSVPGEVFSYYNRHDRLAAVNDDVVIGVFAVPGPAEVLDARTGETRLKLTEGLQVTKSDDAKFSHFDATVAELQNVLVGERIVQAQGRDVVSLDLKTGKRQWAYETPADNYVAFLAADKNVCVVALSPLNKRLGMTYQNSLCRFSALVGIDTATGKQLWTSADVAGYHSYGVLLNDGIVYVVDTNPIPKPIPGKPLDPERLTGVDREYGELLAIVGTTGKVLWKRDLRGVEPSDKFWHNKLRVQNGFVMPSFEKVVRGFDALTGKDGPVLYRMPKEDTTFNRLGFCSVIRGVANGQVGGKFARFLDYKTGVWDSLAISRGVCDEGQFPAYGMIHTGSDHCGCTSMLRGMVALQCYQDTPAQPIPAAERLERGVAVTLSDDPADAWPMFLADARRTSSASAPLQIGKELKAIAHAKLPIPAARGLIATEWAESNVRNGAITAPVVAGDLLVAAASEAQSVHAFDAVTGAARWSHLAGGRIDSPPTLARGLVVFGSRDGSITALRNTDGALVWRHFVAPNRRQIVVDGQLESVWPVSGSVMVRDGKVFAAVGRHNQADGGVRIVRLDLATGALEAETLIQDQATSEQPRVPARWDQEGRVADVLTTNMPGTILYMGPIAIDPQSLAWASLPEIPTTIGTARVGKANTNGHWFTGTGPKFFSKGPDWSYDTPGIMAFIYAPSTGAVDKRSGTSGIKSQNGWRFLARSSYEQGINGNRIAISGKQLISAKGIVLQTFDLNDNWVPKDKADGSWKGLRFPQGNVIVANAPYVEALAVTPEQIVVSQANDWRSAKWNTVRIFDRQGTPLGQPIKFAGRTVNNGLAIAGGRLYVACEDGTIQIFGSP